MVSSQATDSRNTEIAEHVPLSAHAVGRWRKRFSEEGLAGIEKTSRAA